jgi:hypothetical protein
MSLVAIVPVRILRKWDALAAAQLCEAAPKLAEELETERRLRYFAEDSADMWQRISEIHQAGGEAGLTVDGQVVEVRP